MNKHEPVQRAKVFWSGRSQAVRLPKEFRFEGDEVLISRDGDSVILEPLPKGWDWLSKMPGKIDDDWVAAVETDVPMPDSTVDFDDPTK